MSVSRRSVLKGAATVSAAASLPVLAESTNGALTVFDSNIPESRAFGWQAKSQLDVADLHGSNWQALRGAMKGVRSVKGLTGWSDWVVARGLLEERGFRLKSEASVAAPLSGHAHLFKWEMG